MDIGSIALFVAICVFAFLVLTLSDKCVPPGGRVN